MACTHELLEESELGIGPVKGLASPHAAAQLSGELAEMLDL